MAGSKLARWRTPAIVVATILLAISATTSALVNFLHEPAPQLALTIDPQDPVALATDMQTRLAAGGVLTGGQRAIGAVARRSVTRAPINPEALRLSGLASSAGGEDAVSNASIQMRLANRMSRRDLASQLWLIEDAVNRNDVAAALYHYDVALRVRDSVRPLLYPVLTQALEEPVIRKRFLPYMEAKPRWLPSFLRFAVANSEDRRSLAALSRAAGGFPEGESYASLDAELMVGLVQQSAWQSAVDHLKRTTDAADELLTTIEMSPNNTDLDFAPFVWRPMPVDKIQSGFFASESGPVELELVVESGYQGGVATKTLGLTPGNYRVRANIRAQDAFRGAQMRWLLRCGEEGSPRYPVNETFPVERENPVDVAFVVPSGCPTQELQLGLMTSPAPGNMTITISDPKLVRTGSAAAE
ncbi:hypothetical protein [Alteriqipengyuania sp. 357]